jgi:hypothetical protein
LEDQKKQWELNRINEKKLSNALKLELHLKQKIYFVENYISKTSQELDNVKPIYSVNYKKALEHLKSQFDPVLQKIKFSNDFTNWSSQDDDYYSMLTGIEAYVDKYKKFHMMISKAVKNGDKKTLRLLKADSDISVIIDTIVNEPVTL